MLSKVRKKLPAGVVRVLPSIVLLLLTFVLISDFMLVVDDCDTPGCIVPIHRWWNLLHRCYRLVISLYPEAVPPTAATRARLIDSGASVLRAAPVGELQGKGSRNILIWIAHVTVISPAVNRLVETLAERTDVELRLIGYRKTWFGWGTRLRNLHQHLSQYPSEEVVLLADAFDVLLVPGCSTSEVSSRFSKFGVPIVFMAELGLWPHKSIRQDYVDYFAAKNINPGRHQYLNAGVFLAKAGYISALIKALYPYDEYDDQALFTHAFLRDFVYYFEEGQIKFRANRSLSVSSPYTFDRYIYDTSPIPASARQLISLDYNSTLLLSLNEIKDEELRWDNITLVDTKAGRVTLLRDPNTRPCIVHQSGNRRNLKLERFAQSAGYPSKPKDMGVNHFYFG